MEALNRAGLAAVLTFFAAFAAGDPFVGTWKEQPELMRLAPPFVLTFERDGDNGIRRTGVGEVQYSARFDGKKYPMTGSAVADQISVRRIDENTIETTSYAKANGQALPASTWTVSSDGKTLTGSIGERETYYERVGGDAGASIFGTWRWRSTSAKPATLTITKTEKAYHFMWTRDGKLTLEATTALDGRPVPRLHQVQYADQAVKLRLDERTILTSAQRKGQTVIRGIYRLLPDGNTIEDTNFWERPDGSMYAQTVVFKRQQ